MWGLYRGSTPPLSLKHQQVKGRSSSVKVPDGLRGCRGTSLGPKTLKA